MVEKPLRFLVIGANSRELAIMNRMLIEHQQVHCLSDIRNPELILMKDQYTSLFSFCVLSELNHQQILDYGIKYDIDLVIVMHEKWIFSGLANLLDEIGIASMFPDSNTTFLELDKIVTKRLVKYIAPSCVLENVSFDSIDSLYRFVKDHPLFVVIRKVDGKYVTSIESGDTLPDYVPEDLESLWVESYFEGVDISITALVSGGSMLFFPIGYDFPHLKVGEKEVKTGGMGAIYPAANELLLPSEHLEACRTVMRDTLKCLTTRGIPYRGFLIGQFRVNQDKAVFIEYDIHPGEPQFVNLIHKTKSSFVDTVIRPYLSNSLLQSQVVFGEDYSSISLCLAPKGYPSNTGTKEFDTIITGNTRVNDNNVITYMSNLSLLDNGNLLSNGRRFLTILSEASSVAEAKLAIGNFISIRINNIDSIVFNKQLIS